MNARPTSRLPYSELGSDAIQKVLMLSVGVDLIGQCYSMLSVGADLIGQCYSGSVPPSGHFATEIFCL